MSAKHTTLILLLWCSMVVRSVLASEPFLVRNGQSHAEIVIADQPVPVVKLAAKDLQSYVEKISGAKLAIVTKPSTSVPIQIYVGKSPHTDRLGIAGEELRHGAYRMVSGENWLVLIGRDARWLPRGLMKLAVRKDSWVTPGQANKEEQPLWQEWDRITGEHWGLPFSQLWKQYNRQLDVWEMDERGSFNAVAAFL